MINYSHLKNNIDILSFNAFKHILVRVMHTFNLNPHSTSISQTSFWIFLRNGLTNDPKKENSKQIIT